jgi:hypothetical protein
MTADALSPLLSNDELRALVARRSEQLNEAHRRITLLERNNEDLRQVTMDAFLRVGELRGTVTAMTERVKKLTRSAA